MRKFLSTIVILIIITSAFSQVDSTTIRFVEEMPTFMGSSQLNTFHNYIINKMDISEIDSELISGRVIVQFCVDSSGYTTDIKIIKSLQVDLDKEVIKAIETSPKWTPGKKAGRPVKVLFTLSIDFDFQ